MCVCVCVCVCVFVSVCVCLLGKVLFSCSYYRQPGSLLFVPLTSDCFSCTHCSLRPTLELPDLPKSSLTVVNLRSCVFIVFLFFFYYMAVDSSVTHNTSPDVRIKCFWKQQIGYVQTGTCHRWQTILTCEQNVSYRVSSVNVLSAFWVRRQTGLWFGSSFHHFQVDISEKTSLHLQPCLWRQERVYLTGPQYVSRCSCREKKKVNFKETLGNIEPCLWWENLVNLTRTLNISSCVCGDRNKCF